MDVDRLQLSTKRLNRPRVEEQFNESPSKAVLMIACGFRCILPSFKTKLDAHTLFINFGRVDKRKQNKPGRI